MGARHDTANPRSDLGEGASTKRESRLGESILPTLICPASHYFEEAHAHGLRAADAILAEHRGVPVVG